MDEKNLTCDELILSLETNSIKDAKLTTHHFSIYQLASLTRALLNNTSLQRLRISDSPTDNINLNDNLAISLAHVLCLNTRLTYLHLIRDHISPIGLNVLARALASNTSLRDLSVRGNIIQQINGEHFGQALEINTSLTRLNIDVEIPDADDEFIRHEDIGIGDYSVKHIAYGLASNTTLTSLRMQNNNIEINGAKYLCNRLAHNTSLTELDLNCNRIHEDGAIYFGRLLETNTTLRSIDISCNNIGDGGSYIIGDGGAYSFFSSLCKNTTLKSLSVSGNDFTNVAAESISKWIKTNSSVTSLRLDSQPFGDFLPFTGRKLNKVIDENVPEDFGITLLCDAVLKNTTLTYLNLWDVCCGSAGAISLFKLMSQTTTLKTLNVGHNDLGPNSGTAMLRALSLNTSLTCLEWNGSYRRGGRESDFDTIASIDLNMNATGGELFNAKRSRLRKWSALKMLNK
jgi:NLR family CARD domain-containing protein 3